MAVGGAHSGDQPRPSTSENITPYPHEPPGLLSQYLAGEGYADILTSEVPIHSMQPKSSIRSSFSFQEVTRQGGRQTG